MILLVQNKTIPPTTQKLFIQWFSVSAACANHLQNIFRHKDAQTSAGTIKLQSAEMTLWRLHFLFKLST